MIVLSVERVLFKTLVGTGETVQYSEPTSKPGVVVHAYHPSTGQAEAGGSFGLPASKASQISDLQVYKVALSHKTTWMALEE